MEEVNEDGSLDFKWGKKRGVGGKNKETQFYESFIYDGVEYMLYDCVYMYKEGLPQPYIGKLTKIWERPDKLKKIKVHWFFLPEEISKWLGETKTLENEIFFASGEGLGLANINPLEAIAGPCNVVCTSKDDRNPQLSDEELQAADFIFYRTFDVQSCTILDKMDDKIGGVGINNIFNRKKGENDTAEENINETQKITTNITPNTLKVDPKGDPQDNDAPNLKRNLESDVSNDRPAKKLKSDDKKCVEFGDVRGSEKMTDLPSVKPKVDNDERKVSKVPVEKVENKKRETTPTGSDKLHDQPSKKLNSDKCVESGDVRGSEKKTDSVKPKVDKGAMKVSNVPVEKVENMNREKTPAGSDKLHDQPSKKLGSDGKKPPEEKPVQPKVNKKLKQGENLPADVNNLKASGTSGADENKNNGKISGKVTDDLERKKLKRTTDDGSFKEPDGKKIDNTTNKKDSIANSALSKEKEKSGNLDSNGNGNNMEVKKGESGEKINKPSSTNKSFKETTVPIDKDKKNRYDKFVVTRRPDPETSGWFREVAFEEKLEKAYNQGSAILLHNLNSDFTSEEVEDIIWHAFNEYCDAKILPRVAVSSPHYVQALVLLKTKEVAQRILTELDEGCLMISNGRPIVGTSCPPISNKKNFTFFGHLSIDKAKSQSQRLEDDAVSTSHFSQPNTIEYDMAMEWCLQQLRSEKCWSKLHKQQGLELKKLEKDLKQKRA